MRPELGPSLAAQGANSHRTGSRDPENPVTFGEDLPISPVENRTVSPKAGFSPTDS